MSTINTLMEFLNPYGSKSNGLINQEYQYIRIDEDFIAANQDVKAENVTKEIKYTEVSPFKSNFSEIITTLPLFVDVSNEVVGYYFQKTINGSGKYISVENLIYYGEKENWFTEKDDTDFIVIENQDILLYNTTQNSLYTLNVVLKEIEISVRKTLSYDPKNLGGLISGSYTVDYKDAKGYTNSLLDNFIGEALGEISLVDFTKRMVTVNLNEKPGKLYRFPDFTIFGNKVSVYYDYDLIENDDFEVDPLKEQYAIKLTFDDPDGFLGFMVVTYFLNGVSVLNLNEGTCNRKADFSQKYLDIVNYFLKSSQNDIGKTLSYLYYIPEELFEKSRSLKNGQTIIGLPFIWTTIGKALEQSITNIGVNSEDIILRLLHIIKLIQGDEYYTESKKNDEVLNALLTRKTSTKTSYLQALYSKLNTDSFVKFNNFIYSLWKISGFTDPENEIYSKTSPLVNTENSNTPRLVLPYKTDKLLGFYSSNMNLDFNESGNIVVTPDEKSIDDISNLLASGLAELLGVFQEEDWQAEYHPLQPVFLADPTNDKAISLQRFSPMLLLKANEDKSFWSNVSTSVEYGVDILTTFSGIGNLAKFRQLSRIVKATNTLNKSKKVVQAYTIYKIVKGVAAGVEITSGTVNALLKLTGIQDTELGGAISEFLFWLELASLSGEIGTVINAGLQKSAKKIVDNSTDFNKQLDDLVKNGEIDEVGKSKVLNEVENASGINAKIEDFFKRIKENGDSLRLISITEISEKLKNITQQSTKVSEALKTGKIERQVSEDSIFQYYYLSLGGKQGTAVSAFHCKGIMYFRESTSIEKYFNEIVHEGTHALDRINGVINNYEKLFELTKDLVQEGVKVDKYIIDLNLDELVEFRARFFEREFQIQTKQEVDFESLESMIKFIKEKYN